jgi:hypothetical protein
VLDGIDAGTNGVFDGLGAVSVRGDFAAQFVGLFADGLDSFGVYCGVPGRSPLLSTPPEAPTLMSGAGNFTHVALRDGINEGDVPGPRMSSPAHLSTLPVDTATIISFPMNFTTKKVALPTDRGLRASKFAKP